MRATEIDTERLTWASDADRPARVALIGLAGSEAALTAALGPAQTAVLSMAPPDLVAGELPDVLLTSPEEAAAALGALRGRGADVPVIVVGAEDDAVHEIALAVGAADAVSRADMGRLAAAVDRERRAAAGRAAAEWARRLLAAQAAASAVLAECAPSECLSRVLEAVGREVGWSVGTVWQVAPEAHGLHCTAVWSDDLVRHAAFVDACRAATLTADTGLPGRAWGSAEPVWTDDVAEDGDPDRREAARACGLRAAIAFPLVIAGAVRGAIEFFLPRPGAPDPATLAAFGALAAQVAQFLALTESEERFRQVAQTAADAIVVADGAGRIISWNAAAERIFGYHVDEALGRELTMLLPERYRAGYERTMARAREQGAPGRLIGRTVELEGLRRDGGEFPAEMSVATWRTGDETFFSGVVRDVTERRRAQQALNSFKQTLDAARDGVFMFDPASLLFTYVNEGATHQTGYSPGQLLAMTPLDLVPELDVDRLRTAITAAVSSRATPTLTTACRRRDGGELPIEVSMQFIAPPGDSGRCVCIVRDITERLRAERRLERTAAESRALAKEGAALRRRADRLADLAARDPLTGLANHRTFQERLQAEVYRARRHGLQLSLVVLDLDHFKLVNDAHGHQAGDRVLVETASRLHREGRAHDLVARIGGEEFAWLLPETGAQGAHDAADRARRAVADVPFPGVGRVTISAGVCDLARARDAGDLLRLADGALYWAKAHGRNIAFSYSPDVVEELSAQDRANRLERSQALNAVRVLARAVDARDPSTHAHSERVAHMVARFATAAGWSAERVTALRWAGLVHDVGKVGVPDAVLMKPGRLTPAEFEQVKMHAALGARIVTGVLTAEQVSWVRHHHERHDGRGYPDGLAGDAVPDGARLLAVADAFDAMTAERSYQVARTPEEAVLECRRLAGRQFSPVAVELLERLWRSGELLRPAPDADAGQPGAGRPEGRRGA